MSDSGYLSRYGSDSDDLIADLVYKNEQLLAYEINLKELKARLGNSDLFNELQALGFGGADLVAKLNSFSDRKLNAYLYEYGELKNTSSRLANVNSYSDAIVSAYKKYEGSMSDLGLSTNVYENNEALAVAIGRELMKIVDHLSISINKREFGRLVAEVK